MPTRSFRSLLVVGLAFALGWLVPASPAGAQTPVPSVAPGSLFGYFALESFGVKPSPIGDEEFLNFTVPAFWYAGQVWTRIGVNSNGYIVVGGSTSLEDNECCHLPTFASPDRPNNILAPFWTDLDGTDTPGIFLETIPLGDESWLVVEFQLNVFGTSSRRVFQVWIGLNDVEDITYAYRDAPDDPDGRPFLVGAENKLGQGNMLAVLPTDDLRVTTSPTRCPGTFSFAFGDTQYGDCFRDVLRSGDINAGVDLGATGHTSLNFTGSTGAAASTWLTLYDDTPSTTVPGPIYDSQTICADVLIERFNNTKGAGVVTLFNEGAGQKGLALLVYDAGNTDTLALATVDGNPTQKGKLTNLQTLSLKGKVANKAWYRVIMTVDPGAPSVTARVRPHLVASDPASGLGAELGSFTYAPTVLPAGVGSTGQVGVIGTAVNAVVNSSVTNFSNHPDRCDVPPPPACLTLESPC